MLLEISPKFIVDKFATINKMKNFYLVGKLNQNHSMKDLKHRESFIFGFQLVYVSTMAFGSKIHYSIGLALAWAQCLIETLIRPKIACYIKTIWELIRRESPTSRLKSRVP